MLLHCHLEGKRNGMQDLHGIPHLQPCADTEEAALVAGGVASTGSGLALGERPGMYDVWPAGVGVVEEEGERHHFYADEQIWDADVEIRVCQLRSCFESVDVVEDPEYDLQRKSAFCQVFLL